MRWIAIRLPRLSLESFAATVAPEAGDARPIALVDEHRIASVDAVARAAGVRPGMKRATALALAPRLLLGQADAARDAAALLPVAHAALAFTPQVSLQPVPDARKQASDTVLLEVQSSLRCFGGEPALLERLQAAVAPLGHAIAVATAATPQAAALLVRLDPPPRCADLAETRGALQRLPLWLLGPGREHWEAIQGMGLATLSDLQGLPRGGLARRFGEPLLAEIDKALGKRPDPREPIALAPSFESRLELFARADTTEQVLHGAAVLLERLVAWLAARHAFVRRFRLLMQHETRWRDNADKTPACTALEIALAEPSRDSTHLALLLRERLAQLRLPAPTLELGLRAEDIVRGPAPNNELFPTPRNEHEGLVRLVERLQARLGAAQVQRLVPADDHRPERACETRPVEPGAMAALGERKRTPRNARAALAAIAGEGGHAAASVVTTASPRPVWLLAEPEPLGESRMRPLLDGRPLTLLAGPERIESGWWDDALAERDYFIAEADDGALVWIYRARLPLSREGAPASGWFLHGRFG